MTSSKIIFPKYLTRCYRRISMVTEKEHRKYFVSIRFRVTIEFNYVQLHHQVESMIQPSATFNDANPVKNFNYAIRTSFGDAIKYIMNTGLFCMKIMAKGENPNRIYYGGKTPSF